MVGQPDDLGDRSGQSPKVRVWRLGENFNVNYSLGARMVAGLSGRARTLCMRMAATDMHPAAPIQDPEDEEPYTQALEPYGGQVNTYRNSLGLDNVVQLLSTSPLVKKRPARLHAFFRDNSFASRQGEPITTWLVRYKEALGRLKTVGIDLVTLLPDIAGWQALNLAGLSEDRLERVVTKLPEDS